MADPRPARGKIGEELAARHMQQQGYQMIQRNYRCCLGEIDLVVEKAKALYFVEVKTRTSDYFGLPQEKVDWRKQNKIKKVAAYYLIEKSGFQREIHFAVVAVRLDHGNKLLSLELFEDAFV